MVKKKQSNFYTWYQELEERANEIELELKEVIYLKGKELTGMPGRKYSRYSAVEDAAERELKLQEELQNIKEAQFAVRDILSHYLQYCWDIDGYRIVESKLRGLKDNEAKRGLTLAEFKEYEFRCLKYVKAILDHNGIKYIA